MSAHAQDPPENADELDADEPRTPLWLPLVGLALFLCAGLYLLVGGDQAPPAATTEQPADTPDGGNP